VCCATDSEIVDSKVAGCSPAKFVAIGDMTLSMSTIHAATVQSVATVAMIDPSEVRDEATLESLAVDSFMLTEVLVELEALLDLELPAAVLAQVERDTPTTVGDIVTCFHVLCSS
jgi:acyl carrier protein